MPSSSAIPSCRSPAIWTTRSGGPSQDLTPDYKRRTVYGKVSRYKLDAYLQLFDFPPPNISAEKRFTTTVPLQRLFLMNSDFVQMEAEELAKRVAAEPDNRARIKQDVQHRLRPRSERSRKSSSALDYLHTEPMKEYEENKNKPKDDSGGRGRRGGASRRTAEAAPAVEAGEAVTDAAKPRRDADARPSMPKRRADADGRCGTPACGRACRRRMANARHGHGHDGRHGAWAAGAAEVRGAAAPEVKYEPTAWGRYAKVLLSSTEFMFIN